METPASHRDRGGSSSHPMCRLFKWHFHNQTDELSLQSRLCQCDLAVFRPGCAEQADSAAVVSVCCRAPLSPSPPSVMCQSTSPSYDKYFHLLLINTGKKRVPSLTGPATRDKTTSQ